MARRILHVWVDEASCLSHQACKIVPQVFADGTSYFPLIPADAPRHFDSQRAQIIEAILSCPRAALHLEYENGRVASSADYCRQLGLREWLDY